MNSRRVGVCLAFLMVTASACDRGAQVESGPVLGLKQVVVYRNGVGYFERRGHVRRDEVTFRVLQRDVNDFLATLVVMERGGSSVRAAAFPMAEPVADGGAPRPDARRTVRLALDGAEHDLVVGYAVETPIWRPSYRLVFAREGARIQAWGIVQNVSGEDWTDVRLSLVTGAPVSFRSELSQPTIPLRPLVTDQGAVIQAVPVSETTLSRESAQQQVLQRGVFAALGSPSGNGSAIASPFGQMVESEGAVNGSASDALAGVGGVGQGEGSLGSLGTMGRRARAARGPGGPFGGASSLRAASQAAPAAPTSEPRSVAALAALATQGGATRYDLPNTVTIPDRSATMVMLASRIVPGERMFLFAPDPGVPESSSHPFHVARFTNRSGATLERGPIAIFEDGAFLGQGMLEALPDGAISTVPFSLQRAFTVQRSSTSAVEGARLVSMHRGELTVERFTVRRSTFRVQNGTDEGARVMMREALEGGELHQPPSGTETSNDNALAPCQVNAHSQAEVVVTIRFPHPIRVDLADEQGGLAVEQYLREGTPNPELAQSLREALELRRGLEAFGREHSDVERRRDDLQRGTEETRQNLGAIQRNPQAADLRAQLTARLARSATEIEGFTRRIVELDIQIAERRVRLAEAVRLLDVDVARPPGPRPR